MKSYNLALRLNLILAALFVLAGVFLVYIVNMSMRQQALAEAEAKAQIILQRNLATHHFFSDLLKPHVFELASMEMGEEYFDPIWMSSTFAVREMYKIFTSHYPLGYYYKEAAINARSPENEADDFEREFIEQLNQPASVESLAETRVIDGEDFFVVLQKGETMKESCIVCHDTPERAPAGLVEIYGPERSFGRSVGEVVSAVSIRIPLGEAYKEADIVSWKISSLLVLAFGILFSVQSILFLRWFNLPLRRITNKAEQISSHVEYLGDEIPTPSSQELGQLTTAFNKMSRNLRKNRDELEDRIKEMELFSYTVSHDLRAPLRAINGLTSLVEEQVSDHLTDETKEYFERIRQSSKRMDQLVEDLLELSQVGLYEPKFSQLQIEKIGQEVFNTLAAEETDREIEFLRVDCSPVKADEYLVRHLLGNLISNAIKFTAQESKAVIELGCLEQEGRQVFYLRDNGIGFSMEHANLLFKPFQHVHVEKGYEGTGMGLAIAHRVIKHHKGEIWVESEPDKGTTFFFTFGIQ